MSATGREGRLPSLRGMDRDAINRVVDDVFSTVGRPLKSASLFYALYWLVEIEGREDVAFNFKVERERQSIGFWWYGTFSMAAEFANACGRYFIDGANVSQTPAPAVSEHARAFLFPDDEVLAPAAVELLRHACRLQEFTTQRGLAGYEGSFDFLRSLMEDPRLQYFGSWNEVARDLLQAMPNRTQSPGMMRKRDQTGWSLNFNGPAWVGIGNHLLRRADLSDTAWVDQCWALEHNNRHWFDKIDLGVGVEGPDEAATRAVLPATRDMSIDGRNVLGATIEVLDANQAGDMETVFAAALEYDSKVEGINLRRIAREVGLA